MEYELESNIPSIGAGKLTKLASELDITNWEMDRTHWAVKDVDLPAALIRARVLAQYMDSPLRCKRVLTGGFRDRTADNISGLARRPSTRGLMTIAPCHTRVFGSEGHSGDIHMSALL